jgi:uroporphyrinogen-III synthase
MAADAGLPLAGRGIVVTRPREQAEALARRIRAAGGEPLLFPAIEIRELPDLGPLFERIDRLDEYDLAIFISPNAVHKALNLVHARRAGKRWPGGLKVAAVGRGSRRELEQQGFTEVIAPASHADSEALLALPDLSAVAGKRVVIFRGDGGRELLGDTLAARGARVEYAECYRRARPVADSAPLLTAWARGAVHAVTVSSAEGLSNLFDMLGKLGQQWLRSTPLFVPHPRVAEAAARLGVREVLVAGASDAELLARLVAYFGATK